MKKFILNILRIFWYFIAVLLIVSAVMVSVARAVTPLLNQHKVVFEIWASHLLQVPVRIERLDAWWQGFQPDIKLENVSVLSDNRKQVYLHVQQIHIDINLLSSILHRRLQPGEIEIQGAHLIVRQQKDKTIKVNEFFKRKIDIDPSQIASVTSQDLIQWLSQQSYLGLSNLKVDVYPYQKKPEAIFIHHVALQNSGNKHILFGRLDLLKKKVVPLRVGVIAQGGLSNLSKLDSQIYIQFNNVDQSGWNYLPKFGNYQIVDGVYNGEVWLHRKDEKWTFLQSLFSVNNLHLKFLKNNKTLEIKKVSGNVVWKPTEQGWQLSGNHIQLTTNVDVWPENKFNLEIDHSNGQSKQTLWIQHLHIYNTQMLLMRGGLLPQQSLKMLQSLNVKGELRDLYIQHQGDIKEAGTYHCVSRLHNLRFQRWQHIPGVTDLSGTIDFSNDQGSFKLNSQKTSLDFGNLFQDKLMFDSMFGKLKWYKRPDGIWALSLKDFSASNQHLGVSAQMAMLFPYAGKNPIISVLGGVDIDDTSQVHRYFPVGILSKDVADWLNHAFVSGKGAKASVILRGPAKDFPFDKGAGTFIVDAQIRKTEFHYAPGWPNAQNIQGELIFNKRQMLCHATKGEVYNAKLQYVNAEIPYMGDKHPNVLKLDGLVNGDAGDMLQYLKDSPLKEGIGEDLSPIKLDGKGSVDIRLLAPLATPKKTKINGTATLQNVKLQVPIWGIDADALNGKLLFTQDDLMSEGLSAKFLGESAELILQTEHEKNRVPYTEIKLHSKASVSKLFNQFKLKKISELTGNIDYHATIDLRTAKEDTRQNHISINSDLYGLQSTFPVPFDKPINSVLPFKADIDFGVKHPTNIRATFLNRLSTALTFSKKANQLTFYGGNVYVGKKTAAKPQREGLYINGSLPTFDWQFWERYLKLNDKKQFTEKHSPFFASIKSVLKEIKLTIGNIALFDQNFKNGIFTLIPKSNGWQFGVSSLQIVGSLLIPANFPHGQLVGNFSKLYLKKIEGLTKGKVNPGELPSIKLSVGEFQYNNHYFGRVNINAIAQNNTWIIRQLSVGSSVLSGAFSGYWKRLEVGGDRSHLQGGLRTNDLKRLFKSFDFHSSLEASNGRASFDVTWPGPIYDPVLKAMVGNLSLNFGQGRIVDLGGSAAAKLNMGRILTVLSLNRIFSMNFRDFTQKGYSFDSMKGDLRLNSGKLTTKNLMFKGSVADMIFNGDINIVKKWVDLDLRVIPHITSSVPIIAGVVINPLVGLAIWAADKLVGEQVDKVASYYYTVKGPWQKPVVTKKK